MQVNPTPVKRATAKSVRSKAKKVSKPNSLLGDKVVSEKEMRLAIKALLFQKILNAKMNEWGKIAIKIASKIMTEHRTVMHITKYVVNCRDGKAPEGMKELETSWEGLTSSI